MHDTPPQGDPPSDAELLDLVRAGDSSAFGVLFARHRAAVTVVARYYARDAATADDLVSDAFERTFAVLRSGGGPAASFRAYVYTAVRRLAYRQTERSRKTLVTDFTDFDLVDESSDLAIDSFERTIVSGAFAGLPERWQAVLWYTEVEGMSPPEVAPLLGLTPNGVSALAYRAREGLREAYLQSHVTARPTDPECEPFRGKLGIYARGGLAKRETELLEEHLETCGECPAIVVELVDVGHGLRAVIAPLVLGGAAATGLGLGGFGADPSTAVAAPGLAASITGASGLVAVAVVAALVIANVLGAPEVAPAPPSTRVTQAPVALPTPRPTPTPSVSSVPPAPPSAPYAAPALSVEFTDVGDLVLGHDGMVGVSLSNSGAGSATDVTVALALPSGVSLDPRRAISPAGSVGLNCSAGAAGITCGSGDIAPGTSVDFYVPVTVATNADTVTRPRASVSAAGQASDWTSGSRGVVPTGLGTRYVVEGQYASITSGASFLSCDAAVPDCVRARNRDASVPLDNNNWSMVALDASNTGAVSASTDLAMPTNARVVFAGLYWSARTPSRESDGSLGSLELTDADGMAHAVTAARVDHSEDSYQAFADVTALVAASGAGTWTASGARVGPGAAAAPGTAAGFDVYAGWALVVVYEHADLSAGRVTVLDGFEQVSATPVSLAITGLTDSRVTLDPVAWEGDAEIVGDRWALDGQPLARVGGDSSNSMCSSAAGYVFANTFGVDAGTFQAASLQDARGLITVAPTQDSYTIGALAVTTK